MTTSHSIEVNQRRRWLFASQRLYTAYDH